MLKIRLQRVGRKHEPAFRLVLTDSQNSTKSGRFNELLGSYDPRKMTEVLKSDRIKDLLSKGAQMTGSANNLLVKKGLIRGKKTHVGSDFVVPAPIVVEEKEVAPEPVVEAAPVPEIVSEAPVAESVPEVPVEEVASEPAPVEVPTEAPVEPAPEVTSEPVADAPASDVSTSDSSAA